jgi:hypothetical protein
MVVNMQIGELNEKQIHRVVKGMLTHDNKKIQEVKVGNFIADIKIDNTIFEIQTSNFKNLVKKLNYYLSEGYTVRVIYPLVNTNKIFYIDRETHQERKVGRRYTYKTKYDALKELYWLKEFMSNKQFSVQLWLLDVEDYRYDDNKQRFVNYPTDVKEIIKLYNIEDFKQFIPDTLDKQFFAKDFKKETKTRSKYYHQYLKLLEYFNIISSVGKKGNAVIWQVNYI